jgi:hypothetical protein
MTKQREPLPIPCPCNKRGVQCGADRMQGPGDQLGCRIACPNRDCRGALFTLTADGWKRDEPRR